MGRAKVKIAPNQLSFDFTAVVENVLKDGCLQNITYTLPKLYKTQHEDVLRAENRYLSGGKGYLFTNGTGTGKTYVGLGVIKRFHLRDKKRILIVVPTDAKAKDWIDDAKGLDITIIQLQGTNDKGFDTVITTYANFYQNKKLLEVQFDLVVYDESHYLMQNGQGQMTQALQQHKVVCRLPKASRNIAWNIIGEWNEDMTPQEKKDNLDKVVKMAKNICSRTKVLFLSATPFAYHKNLIYGDGTLFDIDEVFDEKESPYYDENGCNWDKFMITNFGYSIRYSKLTKPDSAVDVDLLEREFFEKYEKAGVMSTRKLNLPYDYSREFVTVNSNIGSVLDRGMSLVYEKEFQKKYKLITRFSGKKYNYNYVNQLLECAKAQEILPRIKQHLYLGRKVLVFHGYNNSVIEHPFRWNAEKVLPKEFRYLAHDLFREEQAFAEEYPELYNLDLDRLKNVRDTIQEEFDDITVQFNGKVSKGKRYKNLQSFNEDKDNTNVIIIQKAAGREGISCHDKTNKYQRVLINIGLPVAPTEAIQIEGRIYRSGLLSDAILEYITLQTSTEKIAFGETIAERAKTAENLAMGNLARDLESAFKNGYLDADYTMPNLEQGKGGKASDHRNNKVSDYDRAKTYYWKRAKKNSKTKSAEGIDYFWTPEPIGMKMVEWAKPEPGHRGLEPSAGHGAIARFFPNTTDNKFIEPSLKLASEVSIVANGQVIVERFEDHYKGNRYEFIVMNPPFGTGGKTAIEHLTKAAYMSHYNSSIVVLLPDGPACNTRLEKLMLDRNHDLCRMFLTKEVLLPECTFKRAGTGIRTKILVFETASKAGPEPVKELHDYRYITDINELFDALEHI